MLFEIVSLLALAFGLLVKFVGMPQQFLRNRARRSTEGVSGWFYLLGILSYGSASAQAWLVAHDLVLALTGGVGVITAGAIATQIVIYRGRPPVAPSTDRTDEQRTDEVPVAIRRRRGDVVISLPDDLDWPAPGSTAVAKRVPEGVLLRASGTAQPLAEPA